MRLRTWAEQQGISYVTAWRLFRDGKLPIPAEQLATGTIIVKPPIQTADGAALYTRVSSSDQKADLDRQLARLSEFAAAHRLRVIDTVKEVGSGLNGHRRALLRLLGNPLIGVVVVEHRDRLMRFGFEYVEAALKASQRQLLVIDPTETTDDIVRDVHEVLVSMCARLYGKRAAKNRADRALKAMECG